MDILNTISLESNSCFKLNFNGGSLTSDAGLLMIYDFMRTMGFESIISKIFATPRKDSFRKHSDSSMLLQFLYQVFAAYFTDDCADHLRKDPLFTKLVDKESLASQPTLSRFWNRMDDSTLGQFLSILKKMRKAVYSVSMPKEVILDLDSTLLAAYGQQEGRRFNFHYHDSGYHPLLCYDGHTHDLIQVQLRTGNIYSSDGTVDFLQPVLNEYRTEYKDIRLKLRGDSGFAIPAIYDQAEDNDISYAIRLKQNATLVRLAAEADEQLYEMTREDQISYAVIYGEFEYKAATWRQPRRVCFKIEKPAGQMTHLYTFIVTNMISIPRCVIQFYCDRGRMENFIKESKNDFDFSAVSSSSFTVNENRLLAHALAYNIFNWFRRLVLPAKMKHLEADTLRLMIIKIAARVKYQARYFIFECAASCAWKREIDQIFWSIRHLNPQLE